MIYDNGTSSLADILDVGTCLEGRGIKMVGYKTLRDLTMLCGLSETDITALAENIERRGYRTLTLPKGDDLKPWALYAFDAASLSVYLASHSVLLRSQDWPDQCDAFVRRLAMDWMPQESAVRKLIDICFGNFSHETSRSDMSVPLNPFQPLSLHR